MGKIRVKTLGDEEKEKKQKEKTAVKRQEKLSREKKVDKVEGVESVEKGERAGQEFLPKNVPAGRDAGQASMTTEEIAASHAPRNDKAEEPKKEKKEKFLKEQKAPRSAHYQAVVQMMNRSKLYHLNDAIDLLLKLDHAAFDETVELHINTLTTGISGSITLPHGTGKQIKVAIADDTLIEAVSSGKITFDVLLAEPSMMPKLARVARILGPKNLMPNPKNGTITPKPEEAAKKYQGGLMNFKTEAKAPIMHLTVGKVSFGKEKLSENIEAMLRAVKKSNIKSMTLKSTMSPGIKVQV